MRGVGVEKAKVFLEEGARGSLARFAALHEDVVWRGYSIGDEDKVVEVFRLYLQAFSFAEYTLMCVTSWRGTLRQ